jgi:hypothetical protein
LRECSATHGNETEEGEHEQIAESVIAEREWSAGICNAGNDRRDADRDDRPTNGRRQVEAE